MSNSLDWSKWLPIFISGGAFAISLLSLFWNIFIEWTRRKAKLEVWMRPTFYIGSEDDRTEIKLLFRNLSSRPTGIIDIYVRSKGGGILGGSGYNDQIKLPIKIDGWGVCSINFRLEKYDGKEMADILIRDIDDNKIIVDRSKDARWIHKLITKKI